MRLWAICGALLVLLPLSVEASVPVHDPVQVRIGRHSSFTRVVFDFSRHVRSSIIRQSSDRAVVTLPANIEIDEPPSLLGDVRGLRRVHDGEELTFKPGATLHWMRLGNRVVIDITSAERKIGGVHRTRADKTPDTVAPPAHATPAASMAIPAKAISSSAPMPAPVVPVADVSVAPAAPVPASAPSIKAPASPPSAPAPAPGGRDIAMPLAIAAVPASRGDDSAAMVVPMGEHAGAAALRRGAFGLVVFDERQPIDLSALRAAPFFSGASVALIPGGTLLTVPLPDSMAIGLKRVLEGWRISVQRARMRGTALKVAVADGILSARGAGAHAVRSIVDPLSGTTLLVGTEVNAGQGMPVAAQAPQYRLLASWQGLVVQPLSDALTLRATPDGFRLLGSTGGLAASTDSTIGQEMAAAAHLVSRFEFPARPLPVLEQQLMDRLDATALAPPLARGRPRRAVAKAMIALGMGAEAVGVLQLAAAQDPREADSPAHRALMAIANILAGRVALGRSEADPLADPRLSGYDDIALWRALRKAILHPGSPEAAAILGVTAPLISTWPASMRDRVLPLAVETMAVGGEAAAADRIVDAHPDDPALDFARGLLKQQAGDTNAALVIFDRLARSPNRNLHARAAVRAVNIRLAAGLIDAHQAADALGRLLDAWRGDRRELALREELARLRAQSGDWRGAMTLLRRTEPLFPDDRTELQAALRKTFDAMLEKGNSDRMSPLDFVALLDDNTDLLPPGAPGEALEARLADRLMALDLPDRAEPLLRKLMTAAPTAGGRATFGARLAAIRLRQGDLAGAQRALDNSASADLRPELAHRRALLAAQIAAKQGHPTNAASMLASLETPEADAARAAILEDAHDWPGAEKALTAYAARTIPASGPLNDAQRRTLLHLATAAAQAGDVATLASLRTRDTARMATGPLADLFALLTAAPIQSVADLGRSARDTAIAGKLASDIQAVPGLGSSKDH